MKHFRSGIKGFHDRNFWLALLLYASSIPLFFEGVGWGSFHVVMPALIAFIVVATIAWDYRIIGHPGEKSCLVLHAAFFISTVFLLNRLMVVGDFNHPLLSLPADDFISAIMRHAPLVGQTFHFFEFVLKSLGFAIILAFVAFSIIFRPKMAVSFLGIFGFLFVAVAVGRNLTPSLWSLFLGILASVAAFWFQREDEPQCRFWNKIADRLRSIEARPRIDMKIQIAILRRLNESGPLTVREISGIVADKLHCDSDDPRLPDVFKRVLDQLIAQEGLAEARDGSHGKHLVLAIPDDPPDGYHSCARLLRTVIIAVFAAAYILSPIDIVPDAVPVFGVADDMLLAIVAVLSTVKTYWNGNRGIDHNLASLPFANS